MINEVKKPRGYREAVIKHIKQNYDQLKTVLERKEIKVFTDIYDCVH